MSGNNVSSFGEHLRILREKSGLTQEELAERSGLSRDAISALERGKRQFPHPTTLRMLASALKLSDAEFDTMRAQTRRRLPSRSSPLPETTFGSTLLPASLTSLIGRDRELGEINTLLASGNRLITLTGPGGVGKTRLALHVGRHQQANYPVVFVSLSSFQDPDLVLPAIARGLGFREYGESSLFDQLVYSVGDRALILILDSLEQLEGFHATVSRLHEACPRLVLLNTSRASLKLRAEITFPVQPLRVVPDSDRSILIPASAVQLFIERAQAVRPEFRLSDENSQAIESLCTRLDGLPLAIELAAARIRVLSPNAILNRIDHRLDLLRGGPRDQAPRQQSLRSTLDWSFDLLEPPEQDLFCLLSTFAESFALADAEFLTASVFPDIPQYRVLDHLASLVDKSLISSDPDDQGEARFRMLQTVREYGREHLAVRDLRDPADAAHGDCFLDLAERAHRGFRDRDNHEWWLDRLERDRANLRQALECFAQSGDGKALAMMAGSLYWFWDIRGPLAEGRQWLERALALPTETVPDDIRFRVLLAAGQLAHFQGDDEQAQAWSAELYGTMPNSADPWMRAMPLMLLGLIAEDRGDYAIAENRFTAALPLFREAGDEFNAALAIHHLGVTAWGQGDSHRATSLCTSALEEQQRLNDTWHIANSFGYLGLIALSDNRPTDSAANLLSCMDIRWRSDAREDIASSIADFAALAAMTDHPGLAARLFGAATALRRRIGRVVINLPERDLFEAAEGKTRRALPPDSFENQTLGGSELSLSQAVDEARQFAATIIAGDAR